MFPLFYNLQQAETTRRHEQVLEHVKEKVNEVLTCEKGIIFWFMINGIQYYKSSRRFYLLQ